MPNTPKIFYCLQSPAIPCVSARIADCWALFCPTLAFGYASRMARRAIESKGISMRVQAQSAALLVDPKEAARLLAVSPRTLWALTFEKSPALPHVRCGRLVRYAMADLQTWIDAQRAGGEG